MAADHWARCAWAVFRKEVQAERRTRYALGTTLLFALMTLVAVSAALSAAPVSSDVKAALLWIVLLFAGLSGLSRVFVREEEAGTAPLLRLSAPATAVYAGKWLFNIALLFVVEIVAAPLFLIVLPPAVVNFGLLFGVLFLGGLGLASASTFVAALIAQASSGKSALFFVVAFPILMPLLFIAAQATRGAFSGLAAYQHQGWNDVGLLATYSLVMTTASFLLFEHIWHD